MKKHGYKVCYKECLRHFPVRLCGRYPVGNGRYKRHFLTYTYEQAVDAMEGYIRYPPAAREDGHVLIKPKWKIIPVTRREVKAGIWQEAPF